tara:strand:- start:2911 stop:3216 length:306 start_codon:yes stop_codon:yes gene_type:complete
MSEGVFNKLEKNVTGFETPSEVIERMIESHEEIDVIKLVTRAVISSEEFMKEMGQRKKSILLHQPPEAIERAMIFIGEIFPQYNITHYFEQPALNLEITYK